MLGWLALFSVLLGSLFVYLVLGGTGMETAASWPIAATVAFALLALYLVATRGLQDGRAPRLRTLAGPAFVVAALAAGALYVLPKLDPAPLLARLGGLRDGTQGSPAPSGDSFKSVRIRRNGDGQFVARGEIDGTQASFIIDTGATAVVLRQSDARRAGIDTSNLEFSVPVETANGQMQAAAVRLRSLSVGTIRIEGIEALIAAPGSLNENLLGMSFLRRLRSYELSGDFITLRE